MDLPQKVLIVPHFGLGDTILHYGIVKYDSHSSRGHVFSDAAAVAHLHIDTDTVLVVNPHKNIYPRGHKFHERAQKFLLKRRLVDFSQVLENAGYLILADSAIFAVCHLLDIKSVCNYVARRDNTAGLFESLYDKNTYGDFKPDIRVRFNILRL